MNIQAVFTGQDKSMGYRTRYSYQLIFDDSNGISVRRPDGTGKCHYQSLSAFLANWDLVDLNSRAHDLIEGRN